MSNIHILMSTRQAFLFSFTEIKLYHHMVLSTLLILHVAVRTTHATCVYGLYVAHNYAPFR